MSGPKDDPMRRYTGAALAAMGALIFGLCGLCTLAFAVSALSGGADAIGFLGLDALIGGLPAFGGFMMMRAGLRRLKPPKPKTDPRTFD